MLFVDANVPEAIRVCQHTELGYDMLRSSEKADILAPHVAVG